MRIEDHERGADAADAQALLAADLSRDNPVYVLHHPLAAQLAAASLEWPWAGADRSAHTAAALTLLLQQLAQAGFTGACWLAIGHRAWQPDNRMWRHRFKDIAAGLAQQGGAVPGVSVVASALFTPENEGMDTAAHAGGAVATGAKAAALLRLDQLDASAVTALATLLRGDWASQLIIGPEQAARALFDVFASAQWQVQNRAPAAAQIELLARYPMLAFLPLGWFDDAAVGGALLGQRAVLGLAFKPLLATA